MAKPSAAELHETTVGHGSGHPLPCRQTIRHHVRLQNIEPAVIVEVGNIDAHARKARVLEPCGRVVGEGSIPIVDIQDIVGRVVVGDIDVGPPIPIQVGNRDAESKPDLPQDARFRGHVRERAVAVIAVESIVADGTLAAYAERVPFCLAARKIPGRIGE